MSRYNLDDIYQSYIQEISRYLLSLTHDRYLAEDLVQETFFRAYLHIEELNDQKMKPWLFKVAYHVFIDHMRKNKRPNCKIPDLFSTNTRKCFD
ncbi:RNA polymerase sigma-70 factor, ECF subfamily [Salinibacillus kushneri]|uniref:RNA polymerase sigma-70 factor, ECF subfamily n=1 Tax=Salinibacillus kushneri TaxID=237682 RepID=A0A1I0AK48_9BACI|nr:sigma factor [Salinibacillus kushneri]SES94734.1 RNA polymerase sigma-70 factor, ECF subfamily [Salinibacillus kushneri]